MNRTASLAAIAVVAAVLGACDSPNPAAPKPDKSSSAPASGPSAPAPSSPAAALVAPKSSPQQQLNADMELSSKVKSALQEPVRSHVEVAAADGVVTLYGTVDAPADKERVALAAMNVEGVRSVVNNLVVVRGS
jgi:hypothetical protein